MKKKQDRPDLEKMISLGRRGIIYPDHMNRWEQFKKEWAEEDFVIWDKLKEKMSNLVEVMNAGNFDDFYEFLILEIYGGDKKHYWVSSSPSIAFLMDQIETWW